MVHFVGAGSGAIDLITVRGAKLLGQADVVIYAGSLVNPGLLQEYCRPECEIHDSARMTLEEVIAVIQAAEQAGKTTVRLHTGDSSIYGLWSWKSWASPMTYAPVSAPFAGRRPLCGRSIPCLKSARP